MIRATVVADSISPGGARLLTFECDAPKQIVAQFNTHGMIRRDSASSRAVPTVKIAEQVRSDPYLPAVWRYRQRGMQPAGPMTDVDSASMTELERGLREATLYFVGEMERIEPAKEDVNRYLEAWMYTTIVATATEWDNYFALRDHEEAQGAHAMLAAAMRQAMAESVPVRRDPLATSQEVDLWHLPYITDEERYALDWRALPLISSARCAGVSYFRQGAHGDIQREIERGLELVGKRHWSPTEMPCRVDVDAAWHGAYREWKPLRKCYGGESGSPYHGTQVDEWWVSRWPIR